MKAILKFVLGGIAAVYGIALLIIGFLSYFVRNYDEVNHVYYDGLGRRLTSTPAILKLIFGSDSLYPGFGWFAAEIGAFFLFIGFINIVIRLGDDTEHLDNINTDVEGFSLEGMLEQKPLSNNTMRFERSNGKIAVYKNDTFARRFSDDKNGNRRAFELMHLYDRYDLPDKQSDLSDFNKPDEYQ